MNWATLLHLVSVFSIFAVLTSCHLHQEKSVRPNTGRTPAECTAWGGSQGGGNGCDCNARWHCQEAAAAERRGSFPNDLHTAHSDTLRNCAVLVSVQKAKDQAVWAEFETSAEYGVLQEQRNVRITSKRSQGMEHCRALRNAAYEAVMGRSLTSGERLWSYREGGCCLKLLCIMKFEVGCIKLEGMLD